MAARSIATNQFRPCAQAKTRHSGGPPARPSRKNQKRMRQMRPPANTLSQADIKAKIDGDQVEIKDWADFHRQIAKMTDTA